MTSQRYLLDANCFTQSFHLHYRFDFCPGFWKWIEQQNAAGAVYSLDRIQEEITRSPNDLTKWAKAKTDGTFFLSTQKDRDVSKVYGRIANWVENSDFKRRGKDEFMAGNDAWLIAYAVVHNFTVVSYELYNPDEKRKIKIPALCDPFDFRCIYLYDVFSETHTKFVLHYEE